MGGAYEMWVQGSEITAVIVAFCAVIAPAAHVLFLLVVLIAVRRPPAPRWIGAMLRSAHFVEPWSMTEVMMLGILVALFKIAQLATVIPGIGMYAAGAFIALIAAVMATFDPREVWKHSVAVAVGARLIATRNRKVDPNDAFLAGLMHDIGVMVELQMARRNFISTLVAVGADASLTFREAERQHVGATHETFGDALCVSWNFPSALRAVCAFHHQPLQSESDERVLVCIAHAADVMAARAQLGYSRTVDVAEIGKDVSDVIGISRDEVAVVEAALPDEVASALQTFVT